MQFMGRGNGSECPALAIHAVNSATPAATTDVLAALHVCRVLGGVWNVHCGRLVRHVILYFTMHDLESR
jgi:hypothetical protein